MNKCIPLALTVLACFAAACSKPAQPPLQTTQANSSGRRVYEVRGIVRGAATNQNTIMVEHEDIAGFMPSMTMPFGFKDSREVAGVQVGDAIQFQLAVTDNDSWIEGVRKIDAARVRLPQTGSPAVSANGGERIREGDPLPAFKLIDQKGRELTRDSFTGKTLVFTFIFTRCPIPNFCPLMSNNFAQLQRGIEADPSLKARVQLVSISFDPSHDTPEILAQYGTGLTKNDDSWRFATGTQEEIDKLTHEFSVYIQTEGGTISHGLCTVMVSPDGIIRKIWRGNGWEPGEVLDVLQGANAAR